MKTPLLCALVLGFLLLSAAPPARAVETPSTTVERLNAALLEVMREADALSFDGRYARLAPVLTEAFDFPAMARVTLGGRWTELSESEQAAFVEAFTGYSIAVFARRFDGYSGERFEVLGETEARRGTVLVRNRIVKGNGEAVAINYLTRPDEDGANWRIVDIILGGTASELAARRSEYSGIVRKQGIEGLIQALQAKAAGLAE